MEFSDDRHVHFDDEGQFYEEDDGNDLDFDEEGGIINELDTVGDIATMTGMGFEVEEIGSNGSGGGGGATRIKVSDPAAQHDVKRAGKPRGKHNSKDRADRATTEQVLDPRTRMIILKMLNQKIMLSINGVISTGKEANVYHCMTPSGRGALKVYKTSILVFRDRMKYLIGEHRFRTSKNTKNPRKMVAWWAEKELRNLKRLNTAGIPSPVPILLRSHVLLMTYIGQDDYAAPRLKDASLTDKRIKETYLDLVKMMRTMFVKCRLVHGDLSEYNILYFNKSLYIIDVSQSVLRTISSPISTL